MRIDVWSDIACPWCWLGKHQLEEALRQLNLQDDVQVELRSFELDPRRQGSEPALPALARKYGSENVVRAAQQRLEELGERVGIRFDFSRSLVANTFDAHRVHHLAKARGRGTEVAEGFMRAYHGEGADLSDHATIRAVAVEAGLDAAEVDAVLGSDAYAQDVRADESQATSLGIGGVPFFVIDGRYAVSGAQPAEVFVQAIRTARARSGAQAEPVA